MGNPKLVIILPFPFEQRDYQRFGVEYLKSKKLDVEVWDFSPLMALARYQSYKAENKLCRFDGYRAFESKADALRSLKGLPKGTVALFLLGYSQKTFSYFRAVSKSDAQYGTLSLGNLPRSIQNEGEVGGLRQLRIKSKVINFLKNPTKLYTKIQNYFNSLPPHLVGIRSYDFVLKGGSEASFNKGLIDSNTKILEAHSFDYERYLVELAKPSTSHDDYIVYLDEGLPFHPDYLQLNESRITDIESYYKPLCDFFDVIEKITGLKVVISSHPRVTYEPGADYFNGRTVVDGATPNLVRNCKFVLAHSSTSMSFAVLFQKPVIVLMTDQIMHRPEGYSARVMASAVGTTPFHVADGLKTSDLERLLKINKSSYEKYKTQYLNNKNSKNTPIWEVFHEYAASRSDGR